MSEERIVRLRRDARMGFYVVSGPGSGHGGSVNVPAGTVLRDLGVMPSPPNGSDPLPMRTFRLVDGMKDVTLGVGIDAYLTFSGYGLVPEDALEAARDWIEDIAEADLPDVRTGVGGGDPRGPFAVVRGIVIDVRNARKNGAVPIVVDDGSGALTAYLAHETWRALLLPEGETVPVYEPKWSDHDRDALADLLVARPVEVWGRVRTSDYGVTMSAERLLVLSVSGLEGVGDTLPLE